MMRSNRMMKMMLCLTLLAGCAGNPDRADKIEPETSNGTATSEPGTESTTVEVSEPAPSETVQLIVGDRLIVKLAGNMTTGYMWSLVEDGGDILVMEGDPTAIRDSDLIGAGELSVFSFTAASAGEAQLQFIYQRPFETEVPPINTFDITIQISEQ
jgi:inhibitor of cysteine peptidase